MRGSRLSPYVIGKGLLLCASTGGRLFPIPLPAFFAVCAMSSLTGRRLKGHVRERRRLGDGRMFGWLGWAWSFWELEVEKGVLR